MATTRTIQDDISTVALLKVCATQKDLVGGSRIHADVLKQGLFGRNIFVDTAFVNLYAKCGDLFKAQLVFDELSVRGVVTWNALIAGYAHHGHEDDALNCFELMQDEGLSPNAITFACVLKACNNISALMTGIDVHAEISRQGLLKTNQVLGNALVAMYARCGKLLRAQQIFDELPVRNAVTWTTLIAGYCDSGYNAKALHCFEKMRQLGYSPDAVTLVSVLKVCGNLGAADKGQEIHNDIIREGWYGRSNMLGNAVLDMYAKCGALVKAQEVFNKLSARDVVCWTSLIAGYAHVGQHFTIFELFNQMLKEGIQPNVVTFTVVLNACSYLGLAIAGQTYFEVMGKWYGISPTPDHKQSMVDLYAREGQFDKAIVIMKILFSPLNHPPVLTSLLDSCRKWGNNNLGNLAFHHDVQKYKSFCLVSNSKEKAAMCKQEEVLIRAGCIGARDAADLFCTEVSTEPRPLQGVGDLLGIPGRDCSESLVANHWPLAGGLTTRAQFAYSGIGDQYRGLGIRRRVMKATTEDLLFSEESMWCNSKTCESEKEMRIFTSLKVCTQEMDLYSGSRCHAYILKVGLSGKSYFLGNTLLNMYVKCGALGKAKVVFNELSNPNVVSWTTLIAGYCEHGLTEMALQCFEWMKIKGLCPDVVAFRCILKAFGSNAGFAKGQEIHANVVRGGLPEQRTSLGNALVHMYAKCGELVKAQEVFNGILFQDVVSWTIIITGLVGHGQFNKALLYFEKMKLVGPSPNVVTFTSILKACGSLRVAEKGKKIHSEILREGFFNEHNVLGTGLVQMYAKCGALQKAQELFEELPFQNVISWNTLIAGYCHHGESKQAINCFETMKYKGLTPDAVTFTCLMRACGAKRSINKGDKLFMEISQRELMRSSVLLGNAVLEMYSKGGALIKAQKVFDELPVRTLVSWTSLIAGYCQYGHYKEALDCFAQMRNEGFIPDDDTFIFALKACGRSGALEKGEEIYVEIIREGLLGKAGSLGNAVVSMYGKCGALAKAQEAFNNLPAHDTVSWTALITGYCEHGLCEEAIHCFEQMKHDGFVPDSVALSVVLKACGSIGAAEKSHDYFEKLSFCNSLIPTSQHYSSVVDALSHGGHFDKAVSMIKDLPSAHCLPVWCTLLVACQKWGNVKLAQFAFAFTLWSDERSAIASICTTNLYASLITQYRANDRESAV